MDEIIKYFIENSSWIKDLATIILTTTATIIAVLTYNRAKATILQPKRTEIIKIQTQSLIDYLKSISQDGENLDSSVDYINVYRFNYFLALRRAGLIDIDYNSPIYKELNQSIAGWYDYSDYSHNSLAMIQGNLEAYDNIYLENERNEGCPRDRIILTHKSWEFIKRLRVMSTDPFLPSDIIEILNQIGKNMCANLFGIMHSSITENVGILNESFDEITTTGKAYKQFESVRLNHIKDYKDLSKKIRQYLTIDQKW